MVTFHGTCLGRALKVDGALFEGAINPIEIEKTTSKTKQTPPAGYVMHKSPCIKDTYYIFFFSTHDNLKGNLG